MDHFGDLLGGVGVDVFQAFLDGVHKSLDDLRVLLHVGSSGGVGGVGHVAGIHPQGRHHISLSLLLQGGSEGLKFHCVVRPASREGGGGQAEADALVDGEVRLGIQAVFFQDVLEDHFRHAAGPAAQHGFSL